MGDTVEALSYKTDVKARVSDAVTDKKNAIMGKGDELVNKITGAAPDPNAVAQNARQAVSVAQENPLGLAVGALAIGFLAGMIVPTTSIEDERLGPVADQVKSQVQDTAQQALEHGRQVAQDVVQAAAQTAQESGRTHGQELADSARDNLQTASSQVGGAE
jgi:hypothetical protein